MAGLLALLQVLFGLALSLHLLPRLTALLLSPAGVWIETSRGGYGPYHLFTLVILPTLVVLMLRYLLHRERPGTLFNPAGLGDQVRLGVTAGALLLLWQSMAAFVPGLLAGQAQALGLRTPGDFLANGTVYALFVSGYREELLYRGFATAAVSSAVPGSWGLLVPVLLFSGWHFFNSPNLAVALMFVVTTLPGAVVLTAAYRATGRIYAPWTAHALNNAVGSVLMAMAVFQPGWFRPASLIMALAALAWTVTHRRDLCLLVAHAIPIFSTLNRNGSYGVTLLGLTAAGVWLHWILPPRGLSAYTLQALGLALAYALVRTIAHPRAKKAADAAPYAPPLPLSPTGSDGPHRPPGPPGC